jgi:hypothetical protein
VHDGHAHDRHRHEHGGHEHLSHVPDTAAPAVYAARAGVVFDPAARDDQVERTVVRFLDALSGELAAAGSTLIGHVKGTVVAAGGGDLAFHLTTLSGAPAVTGGHAGLVAAVTLTVNVIVFGVDETALPPLVHDAWARAAGGASTTWPD